MNLRKRWAESSLRYQSFLGARFEERLKAYFCDLALLFVIWVVALNYFLTILPVWLFFVLQPLYFFVCHYFFKATLGKLIFGLRLSNLNEDQELSARSLAGRETLGRLVSTSFLFVGYFWAFSKDRCAWHDKLFGSKIITVRRQDPTSVQTVSRAFMYGTVFSLIMGVTFCAHMLFSPLPLISFMKKLQTTNLKFEGFEGNFLRGYKIKSVRYEGENAEVLFTSVTIKPTLSTGIASFEVDGGEIVLERYEDAKEAAAPLLSQLAKMSHALTFKPEYTDAVTVASIQLRNIKITGDFGLREVLQITDPQVQMISIKNLSMNDAGDFKIESVEILSDTFKLSLAKFRFEQGSVHLAQGSRLLIQPAYSSKRISQEMAFDFQGVLSAPTEKGSSGIYFTVGEARYAIDSLAVSGPQGKITAAISGKEVKIVVDHWHPILNFRNIPQIHDVSAKIHFEFLEDEEIKIKDWNGNFQIKDKKFTMGPVKSVGDIENGIPFVATDDSLELHVRNPSKSQVWLWASSSLVKVPNKPNFMSHLYFDKPFRELEADESKFVQQENRYYTFQNHQERVAPALGVRGKSPLDRLAGKGDWDTAFLLISQSLLYGDEGSKREAVQWLENKMLTFSGGARIPLMTSWGLNIKGAEKQMTEEDTLQSDRAYLQGLALLYIDGSRCAVNTSTQDKMDSMRDMMKISEKRFSGRPDKVKERMITDVLKSESGWSNRKPDTWVCSRQTGRAMASKSGLFVDQKNWQQRRGTAIKAFRIAAMKKPK